MYFSSGSPSNHVSIQKIHTNLNINKTLKILFFCILTWKSRDLDFKVDSYGSFSVQVSQVTAPSLELQARACAWPFMPSP